jgi:hypothetical protein
MSERVYNVLFLCTGNTAGEGATTQRPDVA